MLFVTIAVPIYVYAGMQESKFDADAYNMENNKDKKNMYILVKTKTYIFFI